MNLNSLRNKYITVLALIIALLVFSQWLIQRTIAEKKVDATIINLSGRQRMLEQKIVKQVLLISQNLKSDYAEKLELKNTINAWEQVHFSLRNGNPSLGISPNYNSEEINVFFKEITVHFNNIRESALPFTSPEQVSAPKKIILIEKIMQSEEEFLNLMDEIVLAYEKQAKHNLNDLIIKEAILVFCLILLGVGSLLIFRSVLGKLELSLNELTNSNSKLQKNHSIISEQVNEINTQNEELKQQSELLSFANNELQHSADMLMNLVSEKSSMNKVLAEKGAYLKKFEDVVKRTSNGVVFGNHDGLIEYVNKAFEETSGYSLSEIIGKKLEYLLRGERADSKLAEIKQKLDNKERFCGEILNHTKEGNPYWVELDIAPILDKHGEIRNFVSVHTNVSERKEREIQSNQQKKWLEQTLAKLKKEQSQLVVSEKIASQSQFTAGVMHEISNPINFITSGATALNIIIVDLVDLLEMYEKLEKLDLGEKEAFQTEINEFKEDIEYEEIKEDLKNIIVDVTNGADKTNEIIRSLWIFSNGETKKKQTQDLKEIIESSLTILKNLFEGRVEISKSYQRTPFVHCSAGELAQVFSNILSNAIQAVEKNGKISISTELYVANANDSQLDDGKQYVLATIKDDGKGIPESVINNIFDSFFTTKKNEGGTGLGLSASKEIIENHGGKIQVESQAGEGTTLKIFVPAV